jgi:hypothetical protein
MLFYENDLPAEDTILFLKELLKLMKILPQEKSILLKILKMLKKKVQFE